METGDPCENALQDDPSSPEAHLPSILLSQRNGFQGDNACCGFLYRLVVYVLAHHVSGATHAFLMRAPYSFGSVDLWRKERQFYVLCLHVNRHISDGLNES